MKRFVVSDMVNFGIALLGCSKEGAIDCLVYSIMPVHVISSLAALEI